MGHSILKKLALGAAVSVNVLVPAVPAASQIAVFDPTNHAQNVLQAARALQQIDQQIKMLQNQAKHLQKLDYSSIDQVSGALKKIDQLIGKAEGVAFDVQSVDAKFNALFPEVGNQNADQALRAAKSRWQSAMAGFRHTMAVQAQVVENVRADEALLKDLVQRSQGAEGSLQVSQASNQLLALAAKQQFQIQSLMAAQYRADTMEQARRTQAEGEARAATKRFLGKGRAYTPQ
jgi:P-type conjugative transfer protein TrbJ